MPDALQTTEPNRIRDLSKLSDAERVLIAHLHQTGKTQTEIAQIVGCSQPSVSRWLNMLEPTDALARKRAYNLSLKAVESLRRAWKAAEQAGKSGPQEAILKASGVLGQDASSGVTIVLGGDIQDVTIVSQGNGISNYQTQTLGECVPNQSLTAPQSSATEAKAVGER